MKTGGFSWAGLKKYILTHKLQAALILVILLGGLGAWRYLAGKGNSGNYTTANVSYGDIVQSISASGTVEPVQSVTLTFKSEGYVETCNVHVGDRVKKGEVLATERVTDLENSLKQAQASLMSAQANYDKVVANHPHEIAQIKAQMDADKISLDNARATLDRQQALFEAGLISQSELETAKSNYQSALAKYQSDQSNLAISSNTADIRSAQAQLQSAQAAYDQAYDNLNNARIIAPFDGYVAEINGNTGQWTTGGTANAGSSSSSSNSNQFYIYLASTELQLSTKINEADISYVKTGQKVTFTVDPYPDRTFTGKIASVAPIATAVDNVEMFNAIVSIDDYHLLKSGLPASIKIIYGSAKHVLTVPQEALSFAQTHRLEFMNKQGLRSKKPAGNRRSAANTASTSTFSSSAGNSYVVVLRNGQPRLQQVKTGLSDDVNIEIKSGLNEGDIVITGQQTTSNNSSTNSSSSRTSNYRSRTGSQQSPGGMPPDGGMGGMMGGGR